VTTQGKAGSSNANRAESTELAREELSAGWPLQQRHGAKRDGREFRDAGGMMGNQARYRAVIGIGRNEWGLDERKAYCRDMFHVQHHHHSVRHGRAQQEHSASQTRIHPRDSR
jgi:hypothetical protein